MKKIALWGAGNAGSYLYSEANLEYEIICFIDNNAGRINPIDDNIPIIRPEQYKAIDKDDVYGVLIALDNDYVILEILDQIKTLGIQRVGIVKPMVLFQKKVKWEDIIWFNPMEKVFFPYLETNIVDQCNLKCKGCTHFSNLFHSDDKDEETLPELERDLRVLSQKAYIRKFRILGGEPLLSADFVEYINVARKWLPDTDIRVVTNGILIPQMKKDVLECLQQNNILLDISTYPPTKRLKEKIVQCLETAKIRYIFSPEVHQFSRGLDMRGENNPEKSYKACTMYYCRFLRHGKIYTCPLAGMLYKYIDFYDIKDFHLNMEIFGKDIHDESLDWGNIYQLLNKPMELCKYCDENGGELFEWSASNKPQKEDWLVGQ